MSDPFLAEIRIFPFSYAPAGWQMCSGQLLPITQYSTLFSLIGTYYGGDGVRTFALPDFEGNIPVCAGSAPGLSVYAVGQFDGGQTVTLLDSQSPLHNHAVNATKNKGTGSTPAGQIYARGDWADPNGTGGALQLYSGSAPNVPLKSTALGFTGGGQPHNNMMPTLTLNFCISMQGVFPQRP
jgi:microcystin-dependent protein